jgi:hypothetical protein
MKSVTLRIGLCSSEIQSQSPKVYVILFEDKTFGRKLRLE